MSLLGERLIARLLPGWLQIVRDDGITITPQIERQVTAIATRVCEQWASIIETSMKRTMVDAMRYAMGEGLLEHLAASDPAAVAQIKTVMGERGEDRLPATLAALDAALSAALDDMERLLRFNNPAWRALASGFFA